MDTGKTVAFLWSERQGLAGACSEALLPVGVDLYCSASLTELSRIVFGGTVAVIITEDHVGESPWTKVMDVIDPLPDKPSVVVIANQPTPEFWATALSEGAYDVVDGPDNKIGLASIVRGAQYRYERSREIREARQANSMVQTA